MTDAPREAAAANGNLVDILADRVWASATFQKAARWAEVARLRQELDLGEMPFEEGLARKLVQSAGILSASKKQDHRRAAYRVATNVHYLLRDEDLSYAPALRVILGRLGNFPAFETDSTVAQAAGNLPLRLLIEEVSAVGDRTVRVGQREAVLTNFQHKLWRTFTNGADAAIAAPTSAGKSFVLQSYLNSRFSDGGSLSVVYVVPTRALISQVSEDLEAAVRDIAASRPHISTVPPDPLTELKERVIYVLTPERLQLLLGAHPEFRPSLVVVDEAHLIGDGARGVLLQWVLDDVLEHNPKPQILFASPTISNLDVFGHLFGIQKIVEARSVEPTVAQNFIIARVIDRASGEVQFTSVGDGVSEEIPLGTLQLTGPLSSKFDKLAHIPAALGRGRLNIVYVNGAADAERVALALAHLHGDREPTPAQVELAQVARDSVHPRYALCQCLIHGVGFHYSSMPASLRTAIEHAFERGELNFMVCTSTLLQGVNTPAQNIFMFAPEKGSGRPISPVDFWNLSGRAGRLRKEFQGNIFLIDYGSWRTQPLTGPKAAAVVPAIRAGIVDADELIRVISDAPSDYPRNRLDLESTFSKLLADYNRGALSDVFKRAGISPESNGARRISKALSAAASDISIPTIILKQSSNVSAHKQQRLFDELVERIRRNPKTAKARMTPPHPRNQNAYEAYSSILHLCYRMIWERPEGSRLHRFHALIALWWMRGIPLPRIIQNQLKRQKDKDPRTVIRDTLSLVEDHIRFRAVRVFTTYNALLALAYHQEGIAGGMESIPSIPLFLELGASSRTMISLMELGLTRATSAELGQRARNKNMDAVEALTWLRGLGLEAMNLSSAMTAEASLVRLKRQGLT